jgi:hypothetical protein
LHIVTQLMDVERIGDHGSNCSWLLLRVIALLLSFGGKEMKYGMKMENDGLQQCIENHNHPIMKRKAS